MRLMTRFFFVAALLGVACTKANPHRCCNDRLDCVAKNLLSDSQCEGGLVCRDDECVAVPCASSDSCSPAAPFCVDGFCADQCAEDTQCPGFGGETAMLCVAGGCIECRTSADCTNATLPFCAAGVCSACFTHAECTSDVCDTDTGTCVEEATVVYVAPGGSESSDCTKAEPCRVDRAAAVTDATRPNVKFAEGTHEATVDPSSGTSRWYFATPINLRLYGPPYFRAIINGGLGIGGSGSFYVRDLELGFLTVLGESASSTSLDAARVWISDGTLNVDGLTGTVTDSYVGAGLSAQEAVRVGTTMPTMLTLDRVHVAGGYYGVHVGAGARTEIRNSVIRHQHPYSSATRSAIHSDPNALTSSVVFSTFYNTVWNCGDVSNDVKFHSRNNILLNELSAAPADTITGTQCTHDYVIVKPQSSPLVGGNNLFNVHPGYLQGSGEVVYFNLQPGSVAIDAADPAATETHDILGTPRPQGTRHDIGAFEYAPP